MVDFLMSNAWIVWLALVLVFLIVEMFSLEFTFLMISLGSIGGLVASTLGLPWYAQIIIAAVLSVLLVFTIRPPLLRALRRGGDSTKSNVDALIGLDGVVTTALGEAGGHVKLSNGDVWTARFSPVMLRRDLALGERVLVTSIDGATAFVVPAEGIAQ